MKKILVLDDNRDILEVVTEVLSYERFEVCGIGTALELLATAEKFQPDLILLDLRLADGDGGELCRQLKAHPLLGGIPVVIFTAYQRPGENLFSYGCNAVMEKPFDLDELVRVVDRLIAD